MGFFKDLAVRRV